MVHPAEGRAPHARKRGFASTRGSPIRPPRVRSPPMIMLCLGLSTPLPCGRTECVPPRNRPSRYFRAFPRKVILACIVPPRRGGLRTPAMKPLASASHDPARPLASRQLVPNHDLPRFTSSLAKRTHRVRPSEKTASRVVPGLSPLGCPCEARPRLGGAGSARPRGRPGLGRGVFLLGYLRFACLPGLMRGLDLRRGLRTRARWTHASENPAFPTPLACPPGLKPGGHRPYVPLSAK